MSPRSDDLASAGGSETADDVAPYVVLVGGQVARERGSVRADVVVAGGQIVAVGPDAAVVVPSSAPRHVVDCDDSVVLPAVFDGHCHPLGGGGGSGPQAQNLPLLLDDFWRAGVGRVVGVLGHDTVTRSPESLLVRTRALRLMGLPAHALAGEIAHPATTLLGSLARDLALIDELVGVKASLGEAVSPQDPAALLAVYADVVRGSRTAGKTPHLHLHLGADPGCLELVERCLDTGLVDPGHLTLTHVNWNEPTLERSVALLDRGVHLDVTACIRPDYFPGSVAPEEALRELVARAGGADRVSASSDAGGSHAGPDGLVPHLPELLLSTLRVLLTADGWAPEALARVFAATTARRLGLRGPAEVRSGVPASLVVVPRDDRRGIALLVEGRLVVDSGRLLQHDPLARPSA